MFLPRRCVNITSCDEAATSRAGALVCSFIDEICSASSSNSGLDALNTFSVFPTATRVFSCDSTACALLSLRFHSSIALSSRTSESLPVVARTPRSELPFFRASRFSCRRARLSLSCAKALTLPSNATGTALARRCECISVSPAISICTEPLLAWRLSRYTDVSRASRPTTRPMVNTRCCAANGTRSIQPTTASMGVRPSCVGVPASSSWGALSNCANCAELADAPSPATSGAPARRPALNHLNPIGPSCFVDAAVRFSRDQQHGFPVRGLALS